MSFLDQLQPNFSSLACFSHQTGNSSICPTLQEISDTWQVETGGCFWKCLHQETPARFWGAEAWCLSTQPHHIPWQSSSEAQEAEPECSDACGCNVDVKGWLPQCSCFYYWNMRLQITQPQHPEPFSHVCVFLGVCCLGLFWRLCLAMFAAASRCAFLPDPILILHNTGCSPPPLMYTYHLF